jgi:hypothetical protein
MIIHRLDPYIVRFKVEELTRVKRFDPIYTTYDQIEQQLRIRRRGFYVGMTGF